MLTKNLIKGQITELKVQEEFLRYGFEVSIPVYNVSRYDMLVDTGNEILKIQVKTSRINNNSLRNSFIFSCFSDAGRYTKNDVDYFATVWKDKVYLIPFDETSREKVIYEDDDIAYLIETLFPDKKINDEELFLENKKTINYCIDCGTEIAKTSIRCSQCEHKRQQKVERPSREEFKELIRTKSFLEIGRMFNVTDNAIRKWCDSFGLPRRVSEIKKIGDEEWKNL